MISRSSCEAKWQQRLLRPSVGHSYDMPAIIQVLKAAEAVQNYPYETIERLYD